MSRIEAHAGKPKGAVSLRFDAPGSHGQGLPSAENLLSFCFPLGVLAEKTREYLAAEVGGLRGRRRRVAAGDHFGVGRAAGARG